MMTAEPRRRAPARATTARPPHPQTRGENWQLPPVTQTTVFDGGRVPGPRHALLIELPGHISDSRRVRDLMARTGRAAPTPARRAGPSPANGTLLGDRRRTGSAEPGRDQNSPKPPRSRASTTPASTRLTRPRQACSPSIDRASHHRRPWSRQTAKSDEPRRRRPSRASGMSRRPAQFPLNSHQSRGESADTAPGRLQRPTPPGCRLQSTSRSHRPVRRLRRRGSHRGLPARAVIGNAPSNSPACTVATGPARKARQSSPLNDASRPAGRGGRPIWKQPPNRVRQPACTRHLPTGHHSDHPGPDTGTGRHHYIPVPHPASCQAIR